MTWIAGLFCGRYKPLVIDGRSPKYLRAACDDVHLNPVRAGLVAHLLARSSRRSDSSDRLVQRDCAWAGE
jgi:hypothetical protein